jgi:solute carrier family 25 (mitochondrial carnitine/acylcarnitine transporter), member 20/29
MAPSIPTSTAELPSVEQVKEEAKETVKAATSSFRDLVAGGVGGVCAVIVGHPFDLAKVRLQTAEKGVYSGAIDCVKKGIAREGLRKGLYAGVSAPLVGVTPMFAVSFWGYGVGKKLVEASTDVQYKNNTPQYSIGQISAAGFFSAIPMTLITAPFERVKVLLQIQGQKELKPGVSYAIQHMGKLTRSRRSPNTMVASTWFDNCTRRVVFDQSFAAVP